MTATPKPEIGTAVARVEAGPVVQWDRELAGAKMLLKSGLLPESIKTAEAALFIILTGRDLGLSPVQSLRSIYVIKGKVEVSADMQLGLFHNAGGRTQWVKLTDTEAVLRLAAPWLLAPHEETFTMEDAKRAGLAGSQTYKSFPKAMLRSRAITAGLKSIGFDPTAGMYAPGESGGPEDVGAGPVPTEVINLHSKPFTITPLEPEEPEPDLVTDTDEASEEAHALLQLEELLPSLTVDQAIYVREQLGEGADAVRLLAVAQLCKPPEKAAKVASA